MSVMFEILYKEPRDEPRERDLAQKIAEFGGAITYIEEPSANDKSRAVVLTCEFETWPAAEAAEKQIRALGEHTEGCAKYGP